MKPPLLVNDVPWASEPRQRHDWPAMPAPVKERIFDHLADVPKDEDRHFSRVARWMRTSTHWLMASPWREPAPVSGEFTTRPENVRAAIRRLEQADKDTLDDVLDLMDKRMRDDLKQLLGGLQ